MRSPCAGQPVDQPLGAVGLEVAADLVPEQGVSAEHEEASRQKRRIREFINRRSGLDEVVT